jgi:hypothetical protein
MVERMRGPTKTRDYKNICADCTGVALFKAMCTAERYNLAIYNGDDFEHSGDIRGIEVAVAMDLFRQKYQQRRKGKDVE